VAIAERTCTLEEFLRRPERKPALEYFDGRVTQKVSPKMRHSRLQGRFVEWFNEQTVPHKLAIAFPELRTTYGGASPVPDVAVVVWDRLPRDATGEFLDDFYAPPDIAIEILSPGQRLAPLRRRWHWYVDHGVRVALLVDPATRTVVVFSLGAGEKTLRGDDAIDFADVLPGLQLRVDELFAALRPD
jgi:Uma2 family endonuclease